MRNIIIPTHRIDQVVAVLYNRWSETKQQLKSRPIMTFGRYVQEHDGIFGCFAIFCINGVLYIDSELYGKVNSAENLMLVAQIMELQTKWSKGDFKEALEQKIKEWSS